MCQLSWGVPGLLSGTTRSCPGQRPPGWRVRAEETFRGISLQSPCNCLCLWGFPGTLPSTCPLSLSSLPFTARFCGSPTHCVKNPPGSDFSELCWMPPASSTGRCSKKNQKQNEKTHLISRLHSHSFHNCIGLCCLSLKHLSHLSHPSLTFLVFQPLFAQKLLQNVMVFAVSRY